MQANKHPNPKREDQLLQMHRTQGGIDSRTSSLLDYDGLTSVESSVSSSAQPSVPELKSNEPEGIKKEGGDEGNKEDLDSEFAKASDHSDFGEKVQGKPDGPLLKRYPGLSVENQEIVTTNIRHFKNLLWLLIFASWMLAIAYGSIAYKMISPSQKTFAIVAVTPYILPSAMVEIVLIIGFTTLACLRMSNFRHEKIQRAYTIFCRINLVHYLAMIIATSTKLYFSLTKLRKSMDKELQTSMAKQDITKLFADTQIKRMCCGIDTFNDWNSDLLDNKYPDSCCPSVDGRSCSLLSAWTSGCYNVEYYMIAWYGGWFIAHLIVGLFVTITTMTQVKKLNDYLSLFSSLTVND